MSVDYIISNNCNQTSAPGGPTAAEPRLRNKWSELAQAAVSPKVGDGAGEGVLDRQPCKDEAKRAIHRGGGAIGIIGAARSAFVVAKHPQDEMLRVFACTKMNLATFPTKSLIYRVTTDPVFDCAHINWEGELVISADDLLASQGKNETRVDLAEEWLENYLADGPRLAKELERHAQVAGHSWATIRRAAKVLGVAKGKDGARSVWRLPEDEAPSQLTLASDAA